MRLCKSGCRARLTPSTLSLVRKGGGGEIGGESASFRRSRARLAADRQPAGPAHLGRDVGPSRLAGPFIRQPTLILAGDDHPIVGVVNARIIARLPHAQLEIYQDGIWLCSPVPTN